MAGAPATKVLLVVDDLFFEAKIGEVLRTLGVPAAVAKSEDALGRLLAEGETPLAFVDVGARRLSGRRAIEEIRRAAPPTGTRIVAFVSHVRPEQAQAARALGADDVLARSALVAALPDLVRRYAGAHVAPPPEREETS
jgi:CheY-like chemotaxis protein